MGADKMASTSVPKEISSDYNEFIRKHSFGAKYGDSQFCMDTALIAKNDIETALRLRIALGTTKDRALNKLEPRFYVDGDAWVQRCAAGVPGLIPSELGGGSRSQFVLKEGVTCTPQFLEKELLFQRVVHTTSTAATDATLPSMLWFRSALQALIGSEGGHQADIYAECNIGGSAAETVHNVQKWCSENDKDEKETAYFMREILQCLIDTNTFPKYTQQIERSILKERSNRDQDPVAVIACLCAVGDQIIRGEGFLARRSINCEWWEYADGDWGEDKKTAAEAVYARMRNPNDPATLAAAEVEWGLNLGPVDVQVHSMDDSQGGDPVAIYTSRLPTYDSLWARFDLYNDDIDSKLANQDGGFIDYWNLETPADFPGLQIIPESIKSKTDYAPMNNAFVRAMMSADLDCIQQLVAMVTQRAGTPWRSPN